MQNGDMVSSCSFLATNSLQCDIQDYHGQWVVLYFYPKDMTSGCTQEARDFSEHLADFKQLNAVVFGVSRESIQSHERFKEKEAISFELISDPDEVLCQQFGVMKEKSMYGKKYMGIERSTFLIDPNGKIGYVWRNVKVSGHVQDVLDTLKRIQQKEDKE
jgi:thioredoxin-dependent peroxiredoxin